MVRCNLPKNRQKAIFSEFKKYLTEDEEEQLRRKFEQYIFFETYGCKDFKEYFCTSCGKSTELYRDEDRKFFKGKHNDDAVCPICGVEVTLKALGKYKTLNSLRQTRAATFIRRGADGGIMISAGIGFMHYRFDDMRGSIDWAEKARYYLAPGAVQKWRRSISRWGDDSPWEEAATVTEPMQANYLYGNDSDYWLFGTEILEETAFKYCQIEQWYTAETGCDLSECGNTVKRCVKYLAEYAMRPTIEMAVRLGLTGAVTQLVAEDKTNARDINWRAKRPWELLRLTKPEFNIWRETPDMDLLKWYHEQKKLDQKTRLEEIAFIHRRLGAGMARLLTDCAAKCGVSAKKAYKYVIGLRSEACRCTATLSEIVQYWWDYLKMAEKLGYDLTREDVQMPADLKARHDAAARTITVEEDEKAQKAYAKRLKKLKARYEFELEGLCICIPATAAEIISEGKKLHHCVGGYADRHISGKTTILFLRHSKTPWRSYITIEMSAKHPDKLIQIHGYANEWTPEKLLPKPMEKHGAFINAWLGWVHEGSKRDKNGRPVITEKKEKTA